MWLQCVFKGLRLKLEIGAAVAIQVLTARFQAKRRELSIHDPWVFVSGLQGLGHNI